MGEDPFLTQKIGNCQLLEEGESSFREGVASGRFLCTSVDGLTTMHVWAGLTRVIIQEQRGKEREQKEQTETEMRQRKREGEGEREGD